MHLRTVKHFEYVGACRYTGYIPKSIRLYLECGHELQRKASQGVPKRAHCRDCQYKYQTAGDDMICDASAE